MTPGWARSCTCGATPFGYYCGGCNAWAGAMPTDVAPHNDFNLAKHRGPETSASGVEPGPTESPAPPPMSEPATRLPLAPAITDEDVPPVNRWCHGGHRGATVRGNAAYCAECKLRLRPTASSKSSLGTGH